jgi:hypothetical protein
MQWQNEKPKGRVSIEQQIETVVDLVVEFPELLQVLKTLQFVRNNQDAIKEMMSKNGSGRNNVKEVTNG